MKRFLIILGIVLLSSCIKDQPFCWQCTTYSQGEVISVISTCGMNEVDIIDFEKGLETQAGALTKILTKTNCKKK